MYVLKLSKVEKLGITVSLRSSVWLIQWLISLGITVVEKVSLVDQKVGHRCESWEVYCCWHVFPFVRSRDPQTGIGALIRCEQMIHDVRQCSLAVCRSRLRLKWRMARWKRICKEKWFVLHLTSSFLQATDKCDGFFSQYLPGSSRGKNLATRKITEILSDFRMTVR